MGGMGGCASRDRLGANDGKAMSMEEQPIRTLTPPLGWLA